MTSAHTSTASRPLRCAVIGVGRMGRHHARVYAQRPDVEFIGVVDTNPASREAITEQWGGRGFERVGQLLDAGVDAVTIATPTVHHRAAAEPLLAAQVACLIEKPLAPDVDEAGALVEAAEQSNAVLQVGHIVRYDPVMLAIRKVMNVPGAEGVRGVGHGGGPRFIEMDRISPMTFRSVDVGVVLDMMIHDLDLLLMLIGAEPVDVQASAVSVLGECEDVCNARLTFPPSLSSSRSSGDSSGGGGCVANVTASRLALKTERKIRIISEDSYISADFVARKGVFVRKTANEAQLAQVREELRAGKDLSDLNYLDLVAVEDLEIGDGDALQLQIDDFLNAVRTGTRPQVDAQAGFAAVRTAERIVEAAKASGARMV